MSHLSCIHNDRYATQCILIVEDDALLGHLFEEIIQDEVAIPVILASSGEQALSLLQTYEPILCLLDYHLPGMSGLELANQLYSQEEYKHLPIQLMSADFPQEETIGIHFSMLKKPFDLDILVQLVQQAVNTQLAL